MGHRAEQSTAEDSVAHSNTGGALSELPRGNTEAGSARPIEHGNAEHPVAQRNTDDGQDAAAKGNAQEALDDDKTVDSSDNEHDNDGEDGMIFADDRAHDVTQGAGNTMCEGHSYAVAELSEYEKQVEKLAKQNRDLMKDKASMAVQISDMKQLEQAEKTSQFEQALAVQLKQQVMSSWFLVRSSTTTIAVVHLMIYWSFSKFTGPIKKESRSRKEQRKGTSNSKESRRPKERQRQ